MSDELPYRVEYAKTGRAGCKKCKNKIDQGVLRIAAMVQVRNFDYQLTLIPQPFLIYMFLFFSRIIMMEKIPIGSMSVASLRSTVLSLQMKLIILKTFATKTNKRFVKRLKAQLELFFLKQARERKAKNEQLRLKPQTQRWKISELNTLRALVLNASVVKTKSWKKTFESKRLSSTRK